MTAGGEVRTLAAGVLLGSFHGGEVPEWVVRRLGEGLGGVCLFGSNLASGGSGVEAAAGVSATLHAASPSAVVALDEEGGDVTRLEARTGSSLPGNAALGASDDVVLTRDVLGALGGVLRAAGIDLDLAPCADVNVDAANPVIGVRSFGADPELVARHVAAAVQGLQDAGVAACAKHFPGHGATTVDSHLDLPVVDAPADLVRRRELVPFRAAVAAGAATVMTGHLLLPAFDAQPATLSHRLLVDVLRGELGFGGAVVTDALDMQGVGGLAAIPANVVRALQAGADFCCLGSDATDELTGACIDAVVAAVQDRTLDESRLAEAATRVARIPVPRGMPGTSFAEMARLGTEAARRAIVVEGALPGSLAGAHVVEMRRPPTIAAGEVPASLSQAMQRLDPTVTSAVLGAPPGTEGPLVVVVRDPQVVPGAPEALAQLLDARPDAVVVDLGWPAVTARPAQSTTAGGPLRSRTRITTFGASRVSIEAVARLLTGEPLIAGRSRRG